MLVIAHMNKNASLLVDRFPCDAFHFVIESERTLLCNFCQNRQRIVNSADFWVRETSNVGGSSQHGKSDGLSRRKKLRKLSTVLYELRKANTKELQVFLQYL